MTTLTQPQARALALIAPRLPFYGNCRDWRGVRSDVKDRLWFGGFLSPPRLNASHQWELTDAGRAALGPSGEVG